MGECRTKKMWVNSLMEQDKLNQINNANNKSANNDLEERVTARQLCVQTI